MRSPSSYNFITNRYNFSALLQTDMGIISRPNNTGIVSAPGLTCECGSKSVNRKR